MEAMLSLVSQASALLVATMVIQFAEVSSTSTCCSIRLFFKIFLDFDSFDDFSTHFIWFWATGVCFQEFYKVLHRCCWASKLPNFSLHSTIIHNPYSLTLTIFPWHFPPFIVKSILSISWLIIAVTFVFLMIWKMIELSFTNDGLHPTVTQIPTTSEYFGGIRIRSHEIISTHFSFLEASIMEPCPSTFHHDESLWHKG